jgi:hypothetical protein
MKWHRAFIPGNEAIANEVAAYMRDNLGWGVDVEDGHITYIERSSSEWYWDSDYSDDVQDQIDNMMETLGITHRSTDKLDLKFGRESNIGKMTNLPLPKDKPRQPTASAPRT